MVKMSSRSRSRSREKERVDKFGRTVPASRSKSRSRSLSRERSHDRHSRIRGRSPGRGSYRSRSRSGSRSRSFGRGRGRGSFDAPGGRRFEVTDRTNIEDPAYLNARLFIGNLPSDRTSKQDLENLFQSYGKILGVSIHDRGFGFVQFEREEDAQKAKDGERGTKLNGQVLDVKMAAEGRRQGGRGRGDSGRGRGEGREPPGVGYGARERSPIGDDRYRDPYASRPPPPRDRLAQPDVPPPAPPGRGDPYYADPYRRAPPPGDPYLPPYRDDPYRRDPYRRDPYDDPYRDPYYRDPYLPLPPPKKQVPADVQIVCLNKQLTLYAESLESRLRQSALITDIVIIPDDMQVPQMVEEAAKLKYLFVILINSQNEAHKSLTLNILHGTPQEHRNMPMEDAMKLIATSFEKYIQTQREKVAGGGSGVPGATPAVPAQPPFLPPSADVSYLLNLLADNRQLTIEELEKVIGYLIERKEKLGAPARPAAPAISMVPPAGVAAPTAAAATSAYLQQQQQELQSKILNILNGTSGSALPQAPSQPTQAAVGYGNQPSGGTVGRAPASNQTSPMINFDNPNVKKALDSLIQSGPNLLKSLPASVSAAAQVRPAEYQAAAHGVQAGQGYGQPPDGIARIKQDYAGAQQQPAQYTGYGNQYQQQQQPVLQGQNPPRGYSVQQPRPTMAARVPQGVAPRPRF
ncbi:nuclear receptor coactivator 5-like isoform X2 [Dreissena polymorpha]|uniref:nuclear receptor coactivator 5-like isoform X2 n=1 Tax=Dreissena polymorpha TaxID=45954 RepID=UPI0022640589|nr:nuclear receptor coactivator 5-like isoform X2 [Dreissena polymorpha]